MAALPVYSPMLATAGTLPPPDHDDEWAYETKLDGQRCLAYLPGNGTIVLRSRSGMDITAAYPELRALRTALGGVSAVLDGEIVALDEHGHSDFERLQQRMGLADHPAEAARMRHTTPAHLMLFDVPFLGGEALIGHPYAARRAALEGLPLDSAHWSTPTAIVGHGEAALAATRAAGLEGLVCKRLDSAYLPGKRSATWVKIRHVQTVDVVIGGWLPGNGRLAGLPGALLMGIPHEGGLRYVGAVGTGFSDHERERIGELLAVAAIDECPFDPEPREPAARWALPRLVGEVRYAMRTRTGILRHPSWHRLRPDLAGEDLA
ncbi:non-homologous end-joining DNA ligase [Streptomyces sp. SID3343]|uniref:non-homologous end-joining DNA ligase n=1 Tax=Streptomyces sp. SID3343 TaxID=2690260 RepID=UPI001371D74E|nr:non-homologous end-joining DNA ligase [Streptomyces sp. SID3343]MYW05016.1 ATP-dependent DNA ligase [Streptomyces sp. SID3343]